MLPIQSIEGPVPPRAPGNGPSLAVAASGAANENGEVRPQKPKTLPCKYCSKRFRRVEHVQRHERTHTKEKPFPCLWERCGKTFGRRDLLVRHEKLVHLNEGNKDNNRPRKSSTGAGHHASSSESHVETDMLGMPRPSQPQYHPDSMATGVATTLRPDPRAPSRAAACNLDLLSDAALASEVSPMQPIMAEMGQQSGGHSRIKSYDETMGYTERQREDPIVLSSGFAPQPQPPSYDDFNVFLDDFPGASNYLPPPFEVEHSIGMWSRNAELHHRNPSKPSSQFPSRFPSLQPDPRDPNDNSGRLHDEPLRAPPLRISAVDHSVIKNKLEEFSSVLPNDFVFPSRHTLTRFLDGYVGGFHEYLPFLHLPTLNPIEMAPELLLAVLAVGAQYRFESLRGYALWYAAKAVAMEQIRRRHSHEVHALLPTPAAYSPHSTRPSPSSGYRHSFASAQHDRPMTQDTHREPYSSNSDQARLETIQAVLLLFAVGLWGAKAILHEALSLQSQLAMLVREEGLTAETSQAAAPDWETWIRIEGITRTKLIAYCFFNLCSITYNVPPLILTSELNLYLPYPSRLWRAESSWQWQDARQNYPPLDITVHDAFARLFGRAPQGMPQGLPAHLSALGHYILIHALTQHVYLLKQTSFAASLPFDVQRGLKPEDTEEVTQALRIWQTSFDHRHQLRAAESGHFALGDSFPGGPVAFNSTALLRLAYIRLYTDIAVSRALETRNHVLVSEALNNMPLLVRSHRLHRAVFQAIHALSMLVRAGISYVARTKSLEWSIQHSLCNFECAILLSKWLLTLASVGPNEPPPTMEEKNLLEMVRRMLDETEFAVPIDPSLGGPAAAGGMDMAMNDGNRLRQLAVAVVRLWAETFKGSHIFEAVRVMGAALDGYADIMEKPRDRTPVARMGPDGVMG